MDIQVIHRKANGTVSIRQLDRTPLASTNNVAGSEEPQRRIVVKLVKREIRPKSVPTNEVYREYARLYEEASSQAWRIGWNILMLIGSKEALMRQARRNVEDRHSKVVTEQHVTLARPVAEPVDPDEYNEARALTRISKFECVAARRRRFQQHRRDDKRCRGKKPRNKRNLQGYRLMGSAA